MKENVKIRDEIEGLWRASFQELIVVGHVFPSLCWPHNVLLKEFQPVQLTAEAHSRSFWKCVWRRDQSLITDHWLIACCLQTNAFPKEEIWALRLVDITFSFQIFFLLMVQRKFFSLLIRWTKRKKRFGKMWDLVRHNPLNLLFSFSFVW